MAKLTHISVAPGVSWVEVPEVGLRVLCGCPEDAVKHLMKRGLIVPARLGEVEFETGPNAILVSDVLVQNGSLANLAEFPVLQMLYRQGLILPGHPNNTGEKPMLIGSKEQVSAQMDYIYRGNYGLVSTGEIEASGVDPETARLMMRLKLRFAFGRIRATEELLEPRFVENDTVEIRHGVTIRRVDLNRFEFAYGGETTEVDLNLPPGVGYPAPYSLGFHEMERQYFTVIHSGDGDGWDAQRPPMGSIINFQGRIYLIDAGPNIRTTLRALGISVSEVEGIFHTHAHDDHFCGLPTLVSADHRIKYYSTPLVRFSVQKKWAALLSTTEREFHHLFEIHDLELGVWNNIQSLEVKPVISPHPVETSIMFFRALSANGYRTYGHLADIASERVLESMVSDDEAADGITREYMEAALQEYRTPVELKKIDIGGGLIHGAAVDFRDDSSGKIVLAHTARQLTAEEKEIGSGAPFGTCDVLIPSDHDFAREKARALLETAFDNAPGHDLERLLNSPLRRFNPESILVKAGERSAQVILVLSGTVEMIDSASGVCNFLGAGAMIGELTGLHGRTLVATYRAESFVRVLAIPTRIYYDFVERNLLLPEIEELHERRRFLQSTSLFGNAISYQVQNQIAREMELRAFAAGELLGREEVDEVCVVASGAVDRLIGEDHLDTIRRGDFFNEERVLSGSASLFDARAASDGEAYYLPAEMLADIPVVHWKLFETHLRRVSALQDLDPDMHRVFRWREGYELGVPVMDSQHEELFVRANGVCRAVSESAGAAAVLEASHALVDYAREHFADEESHMATHRYPGLEQHRLAHRLLIEDVRMFLQRPPEGTDQNVELESFLRSWIVDHIYSEDRRYAAFLASITDE